jgi:gamma-glutamylcyclotransferase (GGCT)/AIG2-like uncharacterized protein YtfP
MSIPVNKLFVYGSLRSGFGQPAYAYLSKYFHLLGNGTVKGKLYEMGQYASARPSSEDRLIHGELYEINHDDEFDWAIGQLDEYEGICVEEGEKPLYIREAVTVYIGSGEASAWIYWFNGDTAGCPEILSGDMLQYLQQKNKP